MIVRVLTATLKADQAGQFNELMRTQLPLLRDYPGLRYAKLARRIPRWPAGGVPLRGMEGHGVAVRLGGPRPRAAAAPAGRRRDLVLDLRVAHYEALDVDPEAEDD